MGFLAYASKGTFLEGKMLEMFASSWQIFLHKIDAYFMLLYAIQGSAPGVNSDDLKPPVLRNVLRTAQVREPWTKGLLLPSKVLPFCGEGAVGDSLAGNLTQAAALIKLFLDIGKCVLLLFRVIKFGIVICVIRLPTLAYEHLKS